VEVPVRAIFLNIPSTIEEPLHFLTIFFGENLGLRGSTVQPCEGLMNDSSRHFMVFRKDLVIKEWSPKGGGGK
jgi:hypothetical protein